MKYRAHPMAFSTSTINARLFASFRVRLRGTPPTAGAPGLSCSQFTIHDSQFASMLAATWLVAHAHLLPRDGDALDLACGRGRHAIWLAESGLRVQAVDRDAAAIDAIRDLARRGGLNIEARVTDLELPGVSLGDAAFDVIVGIHYLHRPLFPSIRRALRPGGIVIYETFTLAQAHRGRPTNPAFLLADGELRTLISPESDRLDVLDWREGMYEDRDVASIVARRPIAID